MLEFVSWLDEKGWLKDAIFQQDGAPAHTALLSISLLMKLFNDKLISLRKSKKKKDGDEEDWISWPASSPDLNPCVGFIHRKFHTKTSCFTGFFKISVNFAITDFSY